MQTVQFHTGRIFQGKRLRCFAASPHQLTLVSYSVIGRSPMILPRCLIIRSHHQLPHLPLHALRLPTLTLSPTSPNKPPITLLSPPSSSPVRRRVSLPVDSINWPPSLLALQYASLLASTISASSSPFSLAAMKNTSSLTRPLILAAFSGARPASPSPTCAMSHVPAPS